MNLNVVCIDKKLTDKRDYNFSLIKSSILLIIDFMSLGMVYFSHFTKIFGGFPVFKKIILSISKNKLIKY